MDLYLSIWTRKVQNKPMEFDEETNNLLTQPTSCLPQTTSCLQHWRLEANTILFTAQKCMSNILFTALNDRGHTENIQKTQIIFGWPSGRLNIQAKPKQGLPSQCQTTTGTKEETDWGFFSTDNIPSKELHTPCQGGHHIEPETVYIRGSAHFGRPETLCDNTLAITNPRWGTTGLLTRCWHNTT